MKEDGSADIERIIADMPDTFNFYAGFTRVSDDSNKREVIGKATRGQPIDTYGTVILYEASKDAFARAKHIPIREMHQNKAVGKGLEWEPDNTNEDILLRSYISRAASDTWTKVEENILTGYSIKGANAKYGTIERSGKTIPCIKSYDLVEVSLVDNPSCHIAIMRADGIEQVIASDEEVTDLLNKEQQSVASNETGEQHFERAGAKLSAESQTGLHSMRDQAMQLCHCDECSGMMSRSAGSETVMTEEMIQRFMAPVYARSQAILSDFVRRADDNATFARTLTQIAGTLEQLAQKAELDKVLAELAAVKGQVERMAATPMPGGPHTGRSANKHLATDGDASTSEETPELMRQITKAGVNLTPAQQTQLVASSLKRM
jgi:hypothetical protein